MAMPTHNPIVIQVMSFFPVKIIAKVNAPYPLVPTSCFNRLNAFRLFLNNVPPNTKARTIEKRTYIPKNSNTSCGKSTVTNNINNGTALNRIVHLLTQWVSTTIPQKIANTVASISPSNGVNVGKDLEYYE